MFSRGLLSFWVPIVVFICVVILTIRMYQVQSKPTSIIKPQKGYARIVHEDQAFEFTKVTFINNDAGIPLSDNSLLVVATIANLESYGSGRKFDDFLTTIQSFEYEPSAITLGFYFGDRAEFDAVDSYFREYYELIKKGKIGGSTINKVTIMVAPFLEKDYQSIDRSQRHSDHVQRLRRRNIARTRNFALLHSLVEERYTLFMDADVVTIHNTDMIHRFIASEKDIIVPRIIRGGNNDYDRNSWVGERTVPNEEQFAKMDNNEWENWDYVPRDVPGKMVHFKDLVELQKDAPAEDDSRKPDYIVELDSVGGAILFAKSMIYKQGVLFPPNYIIGTTWKRLEGYDGIETEGLCYIAKSLNYKCWGMPNMVGQHVD